MRIYNEIGKALTSLLDDKEVLKTILTKASEHFRPRLLYLFLIDDDTKTLKLEFVLEKGAPTFKFESNVNLGEKLERHVAQTREPLILKKEQASKLPLECPYEFQQSLMSVPLMSKGKVLGVLTIIDRLGRGPFKGDDLEMLQTLADYSAIALENAKNFKKIQELSITDDPTGLYNSRHFHQVLEAQIVKAQGSAFDLSLLFLDLDDFKKVNDHFGHLKGNQVLKEVALLLKNNVRPQDLVFRYGGDEFVILQPQTSKGEAQKHAKALREVIKNTVFLGEGGGVRINATFGVAHFPGDASTKEEIIRHADRTMYGRKTRSRHDVALESLA